jgi:hypothetical protein
MTTFYINPASPTNGVGSEADLFNTWSSVTWSSGDTYLQKSGTTAVLSAELTITASNVTISSYGGSARAIIDGNNTIANVITGTALDNVFISKIASIGGTVRGFYFTGAGYVSITNCSSSRVITLTDGTKHCELCDIEVPGNEWGIAFAGSSCVIINNRIRGSGYSNNYGIIVLNTSVGSVIAGNEIDFSLGPTPIDVVGILVLTTTTLTIRGNRIKGRDGVIGITNESSSLTVISNIITDCETGYDAETTLSTPVSNVHNNTFISCGTSIDFGEGALGSGTVNIYNNISLNPSARHITQGGSNVIVSRNNRFYPDFAGAYQVGSTTYNTSASFIVAMSGTDTQSLTIDPLLDGQFRPTATSPCIGTGFYRSGVVDYYGRQFKPAYFDIGAIRATLGVMPSGLYPSALAPSRLQ